MDSNEFDHFFVLKTIFGEDIEKLDSDKNEKDCSHYSIRILPEISCNASNYHPEAFIKLDVKTTPKHFNKSPDYKIIESKGLSDKKVKQLEQELIKKVTKLSREEIIFEIVMYIKSFLRKHRKVESSILYDYSKTDEDQEEKQRQLYAKLVAERRRQFLENKKLRKDNLRQSLSYEENFKRNVNKLCKCDEEKCNLIFSENGIQEISVSNCTYHSPQDGFIKYNAFDLINHKLVSLYRWTFSHVYDMEDYRKKVKEIKEEFFSLLKLNCCYLVPYLNIMCEINDNNIVVNLLTDFVNEKHFTTFYKKKLFGNNMDLFRTITYGLLHAIDYLHRNNIVHKNINKNSIEIDDEGNVRLANYSLHRQLNDMYTNQTSNLTRKHDIYDYGVLLFYLVSDIEIVGIKQIPECLPFDVKNFISKCICDEKQRLDTNELLKHEFLQEKSPSDIENYIKEANLSVEMKSTKIMDGQKINQSRIQNEFEIISALGRGGFGEVIKVQNKLDELFYAIKRVKLNPKYDNLKMLRELKILSRLNHPNVVRYYSSWIETALETDNSFLTEKWSSYDNISSEDESADIYSDDESNEVSNVNNDDDEESDWINFVSSVGAESSDIQPKDLREEKDAKEKNIIPKVFNNSKSKIQYLYIQMEFCEKHTLRTAIENGLHENVNRVWKLFREILEGLNHIHRNTMIHRDLKPENIFLDLHDHVKIGDFGLAMTNSLRNSEESDSKENKENISTLVGTYLYMAPELNNKQFQIYNQLVDIYSLGIILFEMSFEFKTSMERYICIQNIRKPKIIFPNDFENSKYEKQLNIIRLMLDHDSIKRPTAKKLLQSNLIPIAEKEYREVREVINYCLMNVYSNAHKELYLRLFDQICNPIDNVNFNLKLSLINPGSRNVPIYEPFLNALFTIVENTAVEVFELHGGMQLSMPLLIPVSETSENRKICVKLITQSAQTVLLPYDLHMPFVRYIVENNILSIRRYTIDKVYHDISLNIISHPKEYLQGVFDIITYETDPLMYDVEAIMIAFEIIKKLPIQNKFTYKIMINHFGILRAFLLYYGIETDRHKDIYRILLKNKDEKLFTLQIKTHFVNLGLSNDIIDFLLKYLRIETSLHKFTLLMKSFVKRKDEVGQLIRKSLTYFEDFIKCLNSFNIKEKVIISPGLIEDFENYSGLIYQINCSSIDKKHSSVLVSGGQYSKMLSNYKNFVLKTTRMARQNTHFSQIAIGVTIFFKNLVQLMRQSKLSGMFDVFVCSFNKDNDHIQFIKIVKELKSYNLRYVHFKIDCVEDVNVIRNEYPVQYVVILFENKTIHLQKWDKNQVREEPVELNEIFDKILKIPKNIKKCSK